MRPPLESPAATPSDFRKCTDFRKSTRDKTYRFLNGRCPKIGTFLDTGWRCGAGVSQGDMPFRNVPLSRFLFVLFLAKQEKNIRITMPGMLVGDGQIYCTKRKKYFWGCAGKILDSRGKPCYNTSGFKGNTLTEEGLDGSI